MNRGYPFKSIISLLKSYIRFRFDFGFAVGSCSVLVQFDFGSSLVTHYTEQTFPAGFFSEVIFLQGFWFGRDYFAGILI